MRKEGFEQTPTDLERPEGSFFTQTLGLYEAILVDELFAVRFSKRIRRNSDRKNWRNLRIEVVAPSDYDLKDLNPDVSGRRLFYTDEVYYGHVASRAEVRQDRYDFLVGGYQVGAEIVPTEDGGRGLMLAVASPFSENDPQVLQGFDSAQLLRHFAALNRLKYEQTG